MQNIYEDTRRLDAQARERFGLSEDCMMENAAAALENAVAPHLAGGTAGCINRPALLVLAGGGNNGADGYALARRVHSRNVSVAVCAVQEPKSPLCVLQRGRAEKLGVRIFPLYGLDRYLEEEGADIRAIADCIFGSGFRGELPPEAQAAVRAVAQEDAYMVACDIPSGLDSRGNCAGTCFMADETVTAGALKLALYSDLAKDACGRVTLAGLGLSRSAFEQGDGSLRPAAILLDRSDLRLPHRPRQRVNKGSFGHLAVVQGEKPGAAVLAAEAALRFGAGLVTLVQAAPSAGREPPWELMSAGDMPAGTSAVAAGMGLGSGNGSGEFLSYILEHPDIPAVLDADLCRSAWIARVLAARPEGLVLTPHPKEFAALLEVCGLGRYAVSEVVARRLELAQAFCSRYPGAVLLLKGANVVIARDGSLYINPHGTNALAKGGSGDVLAGLAGALLAQGRPPLDAALNASLAHALASASAPSDYGLTPQSLIDAVARL